MTETKQNNQDKRILIVDDEASIRLTFEMFLTREGYGHITTASTFDEAIDIIQSKEFDLIISDIVLEGYKGTDLLKKVRAQGINCPVVMVTGFPNLDSAAEAVRYGAFDYISKPVNKETLLRFVRQAFTHWDLENEKKCLQKENEKYKRYLEAIFGSVSDAIITIDKSMDIVQINDTARLWLDVNPENGQYNLEKMSSDMGKACQQDADKVLRYGNEVREHQVECVQNNGNIRIISLNAAPLQDEKDEFNGVVIVARDITLPEPANEQNHRNQFHGYVGSSQVMQEVYKLIENVGKVDTAVLVTGESGTGKELAAEALHAESKRSQMSLVKVDCAAMADELLESELFGHQKGAFTGADRDRAGRLLQADKGTLFLDEIGDISPRMQLRLLRFLQEKTFTPLGRDKSVKVDVRIIAATNANFTEKVKNGEFREDLYYRLKVVEVQLPPLRDRKGGIPILVHHFLSLFRKKLQRNINRISDQAMELLNIYHWPGNVRELRHVIERACVLCDGPTISVEHFPLEIQQHKRSSIITSPQATTTRRSRPDSPIFSLPPYISEKDEIIEALKRARGNKSKAAKLLQIDRSTLYRKIQRNKIKPEEVQK